MTTANSGFKGRWTMFKTELPLPVQLINKKDEKDTGLQPKTFTKYEQIGQDYYYISDIV